MEYISPLSGMRILGCDKQNSPIDGSSVKPLNPLTRSVNQHGR
jgi:hypothetical protein